MFQVIFKYPIDTKLTLNMCASLVLAYNAVRGTFTTNSDYITLYYDEDNEDYKKALKEQKKRKIKYEIKDTLISIEWIQIKLETIDVLRYKLWVMEREEDDIKHVLSSNFERLKELKEKLKTIDE